MLHRSSSNPHIKKGMDAIQKHKIRNLRAKLKNLLSTDSCNKYSKRERQIKKIESLENLQFYQTKTLFNTEKHLFTHTKEEPKQFWYSQKEKCNVMNVFGKLSKDEIEQIQEDMIYYLGEENVGKFKEFLTVKENIRLRKEHNNKENLEKQQQQLQQSKRLRTLKEEPLLEGDRECEEGSLLMEDSENSNNNNNNNNNNINNKKEVSRRASSETGKSPMFQKSSSLMDNNFFCRKSMETMNHQQLSNSELPRNQVETSNLNKRLKTANLYESRTSTLTRQETLDTQQQPKQKFIANYLGNREHFLNKRRLIEEEENAQRLLNKVSLEMKQEKAVDIFRNTQEMFVSSIREKNQQNDFKTKKILEDKYKNKVTFGTIVELNEELRKIYIKKISEIPKFSQCPESQVINDRHKYDSTLSGFFRENSLNIKSRQ